MNESEKSSEQQPSQPLPQQPSQPSLQTPQKTLPPWGLDIEECKTEEEIKHAQEAMNIWIDSINKEIHEVLKKYNINVYQLSFWPIGIKIPIILASGDAYYTARLAAHAQAALEERAVQTMRGPLAKLPRKSQ